MHATATAEQPTTKIDLCGCPMCMGTAKELKILSLGTPKANPTLRGVAFDDIQPLMNLGLEPCWFCEGTGMIQSDGKPCTSCGDPTHEGVCLSCSVFYPTSEA